MKGGNGMSGHALTTEGGPRESWHSQTASEALLVLETSTEGLTPEEARGRARQYGPNALPATPGRSPLWRFLSQFNNALIYFLLASACAAAALGHWVDSGVILGVVLINAAVGFVQEGKAEQALNAIRAMIAPRASTLRAGQRVSLPVEELVPGDIVLLEAGDRVPADLRLLRANALRMDEAVLTGESVAANKDDDPVAEDAALGDRHSMAYSGTLVAAGSGLGIVVATGARTEIGRISMLVSEVQALTTPLLRKINHFGRLFTWYALFCGAALFAFAVLVRGYGWAEALIAVVALAVGAIPEGLPAVISITLAIGVRRMAARHAVIRRLPAVETLGAVTTICSDKTGTLTRNEMTVRQLGTCGVNIAASGAGYAPEGRLTAAGGEDDAAAIAAAAPLLRAAMLCNDAQLRHSKGHWVVDGDPMEGALITLGMKAGLDPAHLRASWPRRAEIPFDPRNRYMATLCEAPGGAARLFVKGAPEVLLERCARQSVAGGEAPLDRAFWEDWIAQAAAQGERVLAFAFRPADPSATLDDAMLVEGLVLLGLVSFIDPPREEAVAAIRHCHTAGIAVKMITGDHAETAAAIARQIGLSRNPVVMTGAALDALRDDAFTDAVERASVFARTSPEHKLRIVRALQARGQVVAMTGDGVNDAPAVKQADIGIAMGRKGTEAAKEAAQMVLMDDNFASIVAAVREGRTVYDNIRKVIAWTLPTSGGEVLAVIAAILIGFAMPMTAVQILWINMVTAVTLGLALAFEPAEQNVMRRPPRPPQAPLLSPFMLWRVGFVSLLFVAGSLAIFFHALGSGLSEATARTLVVNTIVTMEIFYLFNLRYLHGTSLTVRGLLGTPVVIGAVAVVVVLQLAFTYLPLMQRLFGTAPAPLAESLFCVLAGVALLAILEGEKLVLSRFGLFRDRA